MQIKIRQHLVFEVATPTAIRRRQDTRGGFEDRVVAGNGVFAVVDQEIAARVGAAQMRVETTIQPFLLPGEQAQLRGAYVVMQWCAAEVTANGALPSWSGGLAGALVEQKKALLEVQRGIVDIGELADIDIGPQVQIAAIAEAVLARAGVQVLHGNVGEQNVGRDAIAFELFAPLAQWAAANSFGRMGGQAYEADAEQRRQCAEGGHDQLLVLLLFWL